MERDVIPLLGITADSGPFPSCEVRASGEGKPSDDDCGVFWASELCATNEAIRICLAFDVLLLLRLHLDID